MIKIKRLSDGEIERQGVLGVDRAEDPPRGLWLTAKVEGTSITHWAEVHEATEVVKGIWANQPHTTWKVQCSVRALLGRAKVEFCMDEGASLPVGGVILKFDASPTE